MANTARTLNESIASIQTSIDQILAATKDLSEEAIRLNPTEDEWSILQILSHICEATPYWLHEVERVVASPGIEWGRGLQHPARLEAVTKTEQLSLDQLFEEVEGLKAKVAASLQGLDEEKLAIQSPHRNFEKFGNKPVSFIIDHFIVEHLEGHYQQILRNLSKI